MNLRDAIIRLAHTRPELRSELVPVLRRTARADNYGPPVTGEKIRWRWSSDWTNALLLEELPGKPLKRRVRKLRFHTEEAVHYLTDGSPFLIENILRGNPIKKSMSYDQAVAALRKAADKAIQTAIKESKEAHKKWPDRYTEVDMDWFKKFRFPESFFWEETVSWLEVEPADYAPIPFKGKNFHGTAKWTEFRFYATSDRDDYMKYQEGMEAFYDNKSAGAARKLFKLLKADPDKVKSMSLDDFKKLLDKRRIGYNYNPTVWR